MPEAICSKHTRKINERSAHGGLSRRQQRCARISSCSRRICDISFIADLKTVEACSDLSAIAIWLCANIIGGEVEVGVSDYDGMTQTVHSAAPIVKERILLPTAHATKQMLAVE